MAVVDLDAVRHNVRLLRPERAELMAVVKADGYGHGAVPVARAALEAGASWLGVALVEEAVALREAGIRAPVLLLSECSPGAEREAVEAGLTPTLYTAEGLRRLGAAARAAGRPVAVHVKLDTGMHRVGLPPEEAVAFCARVKEAGLELEGLWTHFALADEPEDPFTAEQLKRFLEAADRVASALGRPRYLHAANSAAVLAHPEAHLDLVRVGIAMYGLPPGPALAGRADLRPAMSLRTRVAMVKRVAAGEGISYGLRYRLARESTIATLPVGYADGYSRLLSSRGQVLIRGRRYPVAGTVCMDQVMVDCGDDPVEPGDEAVLFGRQGEEQVTADEVAGWMGTISYEVLCGVSARVPRRYLGER
ncbi:MAG TPA: alanine racemase [Actinomycetota bacterium]|nr:alanine racemase [Actinomycetota bacterium]